MIAAGALIVIETVTCAEVDAREQRLHVIQRVDRHALAADLAERAHVVGVVAHQRRHVERGRQPGLPVVEQVAEALVGLLRRPEARELPHRPQPPAVHARVHAARERILARQPDRRSGRRQVLPRVYSGWIGSPDSVVNDVGRSGVDGVALRPGLEPGPLALPRLGRHAADSTRALGHPGVAGEAVLRRDAAQHRAHRLDRRRLVAAAERGDRDRAPRRVGPERAQHDVVAHVRERERRDQRDRRPRPRRAPACRATGPTRSRSSARSRRRARRAAAAPRTRGRGPRSRPRPRGRPCGSPSHLGERVVARDREVQRVVHQVLEHELARELGQAVGVGDDRDVEVAGGERARSARSEIASSRRRSTSGYSSSNARTASGISVALAVAGAPMCRRPPSSEPSASSWLCGGGQAVEDRVGVADEQLAGLGEAHAAGGALDQARAGLGLERGDLARDRGLGERERLGRGGEGAVRGDLAQDPQASDVEHVQSVYQSGTKIICVYTSRRAGCCP